MINQNEFDKSAPVIIGGLGGSGTRVVADIIKELGFYIGNTNNANDSVWFAFLLRRPKWLKKYDSEKVLQGIDVFNRVNFGIKNIKVKDIFFIINAFLEQTFNSYNTEYSFWKKISLYFKIFEKKTSTEQINYIGWGLKEPNSHIFLNELEKYYPNMRFILLVRNGLDMAYSDNQNQLINWHHLYGVPFNKMDKEQKPNSSIKFWIKANSEAIEKGKKLLGSRFLKINFEELCQQPSVEIKKILSFLDIQVTVEVFNKLILLPKTPSSMGRHKNINLSNLDKNDVDVVRKLSAGL